MIVLYIINIVVLIAAVIAMCMQFFVLKMQKELTDMNNIVLGMNKLFKPRTILFISVISFCALITKNCIVIATIAAIMTIMFKTYNTIIVVLLIFQVP